MSNTVILLMCSLSLLFSTLTQISAQFVSVTHPVAYVYFMAFQVLCVTVALSVRAPPPSFPPSLPSSFHVFLHFLDIQPCVRPQPSFPPSLPPSLPPPLPSHSVSRLSSSLI